MSLEIKENEILANHSTFRIGGPARHFVFAKSKDELIKAIDFAKNQGLPFFIFGGGSNILFRDEGFAGVAIKIQSTQYKRQGNNITASAGFLFSQLIMQSINSDLTGLEWGMGIPGTIGGCVAGNCGAYGHSISENVKSVEVLYADDTGHWQIRDYPKEECGFNYRESRFKGNQNKEIILEIELRLERGSRERAQKTIQEILQKRKNRIPPYPSAGSVFKNVIIDELKNKEEFLKLVPSEKIQGGKFPVAWLIEQCGLKETQIGGAQIAKEHANFIVNLGNAQAKDVLGLINLCKKKIKEDFLVDLEEEIVVL